MSVTDFTDYVTPIRGYKTPHDFYWVLKDPAPLAGMRYPDAATPWENIKQAGFHHVVCLNSSFPEYGPSPLSLLYAVELEDLSHRNPPLDRIREERLIKEAVKISVQKLKNGEGVVIHCGYGTGRTGTLIGCILMTLGFKSRKILKHLDELHRARGRDGWPESEWQGKLVEEF